MISGHWTNYSRDICQRKEGPSFQEKIVAEKGLSVIAEIKRRSPSKGELKGNLDAVDLAKAYERAGAACVSVLTDSEHFGGSKEDLLNVRRSVKVPILRKDFTVDFRISAMRRSWALTVCY